jgi:hypothetical protein
VSSGSEEILYASPPSLLAFFLLLTFHFLLTPDNGKNFTAEQRTEEKKKQIEFAEKLYKNSEKKNLVCGFSPPFPPFPPFSSFPVLNCFTFYVSCQKKFKAMLQDEEKNCTYAPQFPPQEFLMQLFKRDPRFRKGMAKKDEGKVPTFQTPEAYRKDREEVRSLPFLVNECPYQSSSHFCFAHPLLVYSVDPLVQDPRFSLSLHEGR